MFRLILVTLAMAAAGMGREISRNADPAENVNSRYTVESVEVLGVPKTRLSRTVREKIDKLVGTKYDTLALSGLVWKIREEVRAKHINVRVGRGLKPEHLAVRLEVEGRRDKSFDVTAPKFGYHSRQGLSGSVEGVINAGSYLRLAGGYTNDGDLLLERMQGFHGRAEVRLPNARIPVALKFRYASLNQTWDPALAGLGRRYGNREIFEPGATMQLARGLDWTAGVNIQRLSSISSSTPTMAAPQAEASNAVVNTLRYRRRFEGTGAHHQELEAGYDLRAATKILASDYVYTRHTLTSAFTFVSGRHEVRLAALAGFLNGDAPWYDRYVLGNSQTLRGYNKFSIAPGGANRIAHGSIDYRWRLFQAFYDAGSIDTYTATALQSAGVGIRKDNMQLAVAFPLRAGGRIDPIFLIGVNF